MAQRICFDIESNVRWPQHMWGPIRERRHWLETQWLPNNKIIFWWAAAFEHARRKHYDFDAPAELVRLLSTANELISFNGRRHDLLILEQLCGPAALQPLWHKRHHELHGWKNQYSLEGAAHVIVGAPVDDWDQRIEALAARYMRRDHLDRNLALARAEARHDVDWTAVVFRDYRSNKDLANTYTGPPPD